MTYDVAFIGTGADPDEPGSDGYAMAYRHAPGYQRLHDCEIVAAADIVRENVERFADEFDLDAAYTDHEVMLREVEPDIISVCVPPDSHAELVCDCARSGVVEAVHCEKPMATTWGDCRRMVRVCEEAGVQLTFNHQMRFGEPFAKAKELLDDGAIGTLHRIEFAEDDLFDNGTHLFDLCGYYTGYSPVEWVIAGLDYREENLLFDAHNENQAIAQWKYDSGAFGMASTGPGSGFVDCYVRLVGTDGRIEIRDADSPLHLLQDGRGAWKQIDTGGDAIYNHSPGPLKARLEQAAEVIPFASAEWVHTPTYVERAIEAIVRSLRTGQSSGLEARNALAATELIFASWESVRRRARIEPPLEIDDNPLESMIDVGDLQPQAGGS